MLAAAAVIWHLRVAGIGPVVASCLLVLAIAASALGETTLGLPPLFGPAVQAPIITTVALAPSLTLAHAEARRATATSPIPARRIGAIDAAMLSALSAAVVVVGAVLGEGGTWAGRAILGGLGLTLLTSRTLSARAAALPAVLWTVAGLVLGGPDGRPRWWAWHHQPTDASGAWSIAVALAVLGVVMLHRAPRRIRD